MTKPVTTNRYYQYTSANHNQQPSLNVTTFTADGVNAQIKTKKQSNSIFRNGLYFVAGAAVAASGMYLASRGKSVLSSRVLPVNAVTESMPPQLKAVLSRGSNYEAFNNFMKNPNPKFVHGRGANSVVYRLPFTDNFVMKVLNQNSKPNNFRIGSLGNRNFGQPIWENPENNRILVLNKIPGKPHSTPDWSSIIWDGAVNSPKNVTPEMAESYYDSVVGISKMKQSAFDDLADQIKYLDTVPKFDNDALCGYKLDSINPNNLMVDMKNQKLNIIDFFAKDKPQHQNSYFDMVAVIADFPLLKEYKDLLPKDKQENLTIALRTIDKKSFKAAEKAGLSTDKQVFLNYIDDTNKYFPVCSVWGADGKEYVRNYYHTSRDLIKEVTA